MIDFIVRTINNPKKQLGVVGVARTPEEVVKRVGDNSIQFSLNPKGTSIVDGIQIKA